ncbi:MAG TPA: ATP-binding protein [Leptolyngbyaceae cyanobacterium]
MKTQVVKRKHLKCLDKIMTGLGMFQQDNLRVKSDLTFLNQVLQWFEKFCFQNLAKVSWLENKYDGIKLALAEGFTNAVRHAHENLPKETPIDIQVKLSEEGLEIRIWDFGEPFDPNTLPEPEPGTLQVGGYGWFLMRRIADRVIYERGQDQRNCLILITGKV